MNTLIKERASARNKNLSHWIAKTGILSACAIILMYLDFPIPLMPGFLKFDFSDIPALLGAFSMGPITGVLIEFIKNLAHTPFTSTGFVGEIANFIVCGSFVLAGGLVYHYKPNRKGAIISLITATITMTLFGMLTNYYINIPFYINAMGFNMEAILKITHATGNTLAHDLPTFILYVIAPFNLIKAIIVSLIVALIYKRVSPLLHK